MRLYIQKTARWTTKTSKNGDVKCELYDTDKAVAKPYVTAKAGLVYNNIPDDLAPLLIESGYALEVDSEGNPIGIDTDGPPPVAGSDHPDGPGPRKRKPTPQDASQALDPKASLPLGSDHPDGLKRKRVKADTAPPEAGLLADEPTPEPEPKPKPKPKVTKKAKAKKKA